MKRLLFCFLVLTSTLEQAYSSNFHEHLPTLPSYEDFKGTFEAVGTPLKDQKFGLISKSPSKTISAIFGPEILQTIDASTQMKLADMRIQDIASLFAGVKQSSTEEILRSFFEFTPFNLRGDASYLAIGWDIRIWATTYLSTTPDGLEDLFTRYLKRTPLADREVVTFTASAEHNIFEASYAAHLIRIKKIFAQYGSRLEVFAGIPRAAILRWDDSVFEKYFESLKVALASGLATGTDITGSIYEAAPNEVNLDNATIARGRKRLTALFGLHSQIKIHSYESSREGGFYEVLFGAIKDANRLDPVNGLPLIIRIGHINSLDETAITKFAQLQNQLRTRFVFEASVDSNMSLKNTQLTSLAHTINQIDQEGLTVVLGTDGLGIFGESASFTQAIERLREAGLNPSTVTRIRSQSHLTFN